MLAMRGKEKQGVPGWDKVPFRKAQMVRENEEGSRVVPQPSGTEDPRIAYGYRPDGRIDHRPRRKGDRGNYMPYRPINKDRQEFVNSNAAIRVAMKPECRHTEFPSGYVEWFDWAMKKGRTHDQVRCPHCGLYCRWVPKKKQPWPNKRTVVFKDEEEWQQWCPSNPGGQILHVADLPDGRIKATVTTPD